MRRLFPIAGLVLLLAATLVATQSPGGGQDIGTGAFESYVESLRQQAGIPAISGAIVQDGTVVWERGLGFANLETRVRAVPDTPYAIGDLTQTLAAVLLLQCVEQGHLNLNDPIRKYGASVADAGATLRQVLSHSSSGAYRYEADRYAQLTVVMEACAPQPFRKSLAHRLLDRLVMFDSVPGRDMATRSSTADDLFSDASLERYRRSLDRLAAPYRVDRRGRATRTELPIDGINAATGLVSTVRDLASFDDALDSTLLLREDTRAAAWSPSLSADGTALPTGLGWFVQTYRGVKVVWHVGVVPNAYSSLVVKVPAQRVTMILLANSEGLMVPALLETGDVTRSVFASVFLRMLL